VNTREHILSVLRREGEWSVKQLSDKINVSRQRIHQVLRELLAEGSVRKLGSSPRVFYQISSESRQKESNIPSGIQPHESVFLNEHFLTISPLGEILEGEEGFKYWCEQRKLPFLKTVNEYILTLQKYQTYFQENGLIEGSKKLNSTKGLMNVLNAVYYADFYEIERFGKTKLGALLHHAKVSQSKRLMKGIINVTKDRLYKLIEQWNIEAVGYIPPTLKRNIQIMDELRIGYNVPLYHVRIEKVFMKEPVPQKSLKRIEDRIVNARSTIVVPELNTFKTILLIDDALGSGATMNETARKVINRGVALEVIGFAVTGSFKGFEVIAEL